MKLCAPKASFPLTRMSTLSLRKLSQQLSVLAGQPNAAAALGRFMLQLCAKDPWDARVLVQLEQAAALLTDDARRHLVASTLYRLLDMHRVWASDGAVPAANRCVFTACVPFTVADVSLTQSAHGLQELTLELDPFFSRGPRDTLFPEHKNYVLAAPLTELNAARRWALNFMLANTHLDTAVDEVYAGLWADHVSHKYEPEQAAYGYLFSLTVPEPPDNHLPHHETQLPLTEWARYALEQISFHVQRLNTRYPEMKLELHAMTTLSHAVELATDMRLRAMFKRYRQEVGKRTFQIDAQAVALAGMSRQAIDEYNQSLREQESLPQEALFGRVALSQVTVNEGDDVLEFAQAQMFDRNDKLALSLGVRVPVGTLPAQVRKWWSALDEQGLAEVVSLPTVHVDDIKSLHLGQVRDCSGRWVERELLHWGPQAQALFKTAKWSSAFGFESLTSKELCVSPRTPLPELFAQVGVSKVLAAHYQAPVADKLKELLAAPGQSRARALDQLTQAFPDFVPFYLLDPFNTFLPSGLWCALHLELAKGAVFRVDPSVQEQMALTDLENKLPTFFVRSPLPDIYLHFEKEQTFREGDVQDSAGSDMQSDLGVVRLDGAFVSERLLSADECTTAAVPEGSRELSITLALAPADEALSLHYPVLRFVVRPDGDEDLLELLRSSTERAAKDFDTPAERKQLMERSERVVLPALVEVCKVLLYINLPDARLTRSFTRSELLEKAKGLSGRERQRTLERAARSRDEVLVGPIPAIESAPQAEPALDSEGRHVRPHLRRGYVRSQRHGEGLKLRRPVWIRPVFVNQAKLEESRPGSYRVR